MCAVCEPVLTSIRRRGGCTRCLARQAAGERIVRRDATTLVRWPHDRPEEALCRPHLADWRDERHQELRTAYPNRGRGRS